MGGGSSTGSIEAPQRQNKSRLEEDRIGGKVLGPLPGRDMTGHQDYVNILGKRESQKVYLHLPREIRQFDSTEQALAEGFIPFSEPRAWSIGDSRLRPIMNGTRIWGWEADLILDSIDFPDSVEGYVATVQSWEDESVNNHFNVSAQFYRRRG